jgi:hypothetical protein
MDGGAWFIILCAVAAGLWYLCAVLRLIGFRPPRFRAPYWLRCWRAARIRRDCDQRGECEADIVFLSRTEAFYVCHRHGLVNLITDPVQIERLFEIIQGCKEEER